jgi:hypothetical protein
METVYNKLLTITKVKLDTFLPPDKRINSSEKLYPFFNLRQGKEIVDYQKSEVFLICAFSIYSTLVIKKLVNNGQDGDAFVNIFLNHLSEYITKDDTDYDLTLHFEDRFDIFHKEINDVIFNGMDSDPVNCIYCIYKAPLIGKFLLSSKSIEFKQNSSDIYEELKENFVLNLLNFQSIINQSLSK